MAKLSPTQQALLNELEMTIYQDQPLFNLVEKNFVKREMTADQVSAVLNDLAAQGKIPGTSDLLTQPAPDWDLLIVAHYEKRHRARELTPSQYAKMRGISLQAVTKAIREKHRLPGVEEVKKFGRFYLLIYNQ